MFWFFVGLSAPLPAVVAADAERSPLYETIVTVAEMGRHTHALRIVDGQLLRYPHDPRLTALRARIVRQLSSIDARPEPLPPARTRLPAIEFDQPVVGRDFTSSTAGIALLWVDPGSVRLVNPQGSDDDTHVTLSHGYWLGRTEITQAQWRELMENLPSPSHFGGSDRPVELISWANAVEFCQKLTARESAFGRLPDGYAYAMPTAAQWEYACLAGTSGPYPGPLDELAWFQDNGGRQTHPVGQKQPNGWGFYDMLGNVAEWCADGHNGYPGGHVVDLFNLETGEAAAMIKVVRGGSFTSTAGQCRSGFRGRWLLSYAGGGLGFRVALAPLRPPPRAPSPPASD